MKTQLGEEKDLGSYYKQRIEELNKAEEALKKELRLIRARNVELGSSNDKLKHLEKLDNDWSDIETRIKTVENREEIAAKI